ncbi:MAG: DUF1489 family protein [Hyphomicrobium sp.]
MSLNLIKLCVGAASIEDLAAWQSANRRFKAKGGGMRVFHTTFQTPKRQAELLNGGSLYWVVKGLVQCRQRLVGFDVGAKDDGSPCCLLLLDPAIVPVRPVSRKAFQGWRYLDAADAPADLGSGSSDDLTAMPPKLRKELASLGLI